ncbi:hypothetical protein Tco_0103226 [Tanacetum coccineum]
MDDPNITMEEYIELEAEKARRRGQTVNWETATYGKARYSEDIDYFKDFETNFPAIVYEDALASDHEISSKPTISPLYDKGIDFDFKISFDKSDDEDYIVSYDKNSFSYKLTYVNDLKPDSDNDKVEINISSDDIIVEPSDGVIDVKIDTHFHEFDKNREANHDIQGKSSALKDFVIMIKVMIQMHYYEGMPLDFIIKNLYMSFGIPFDPKRFYNDGVYTNSCGGQGTFTLFSLFVMNERSPKLDTAYRLKVNTPYQYF